MSALHAPDLRLARDAAELRGLRAARWIRESTPGQLDRWGPPSQRRMQDTSITALGLVDTGLAWTVGRSGWSGPDSMDDPPATRTPEFRAMLAAAEAGAFDVLLVGYTARYMRDLALALSYRRWFHRHGVVVYICDDRILSSNPADWERFVDKCKAAEINSREQSRNVRAGYAAKRDTHGDPGGHPPFGFRRSGDARVVEIDPERIATAVRAYTLAATGLTDRDVAGRLGIGLHTVRGILTSPLYRGRLRDGTAANWDAVIDEETWRRVQDLRAARNRRSPGRPETRRIYALPMLECAACGRRLVGDKDRYRHLDACPEFMAARPAGGAVRGRHARIPGQSYGRDEYEAIVPFVLERVRLGARDVEAAAGAYTRGAGTEPNQLRLARIEEERERALATYRRDRDPHALEQMMASSTPRKPRLRAVRSGRRCHPTRSAGTWRTFRRGGPMRTPTIGGPSRRRSSSASACSGSAWRSSNRRRKRWTTASLRPLDLMRSKWSGREEWSRRYRCVAPGRAEASRFRQAPTRRPPLSRHPALRRLDQEPLEPDPIAANRARPDRAEPAGRGHERGDPRLRGSSEWAR